MIRLRLNSVGAGRIFSIPSAPTRTSVAVPLDIADGRYVEHLMALPISGGREGASKSASRGGPTFDSRR